MDAFDVIMKLWSRFWRIACRTMAHSNFLTWIVLASDRLRCSLVMEFALKIDAPDLNIMTSKRFKFRDHVDVYFH